MEGTGAVKTLSAGGLRTPLHNLAPAPLRRARAAQIDETFAIFIAIALRGVCLSLEEWREILSAYAGSFTADRGYCSATVAHHADWLATGAHDGGASDAVADKIDAMPIPMRLAVIEIIDRFWLSAGGRIDLMTWLTKQGVNVDTSAHAQMAAKKAQLAFASGSNAP
jgi:hypothetical protein